MAEPPKVYPLDVESGQHFPSTSKSTAPLMHTPSTRSHHRSSPPPPPNLKRRLPCFCRCICWTVLVVLVFVILIGITLGALYLVYRPKIPDYSIDKLSVQNFAIDDNNTAYAAFDAMITADNPNKKIGIYYVNGSYLSVWYTDIQLCDGKLPVFYQGHRNKTVMNVLMSGETQITDALVGKLNTLRETGSVPLKVKGTVPVKIKFGELKLWKMNFRVRCDIVIDSLSSGDEIRIKSKSCSFKVRLLGIYFGS